MSKVIESIQAQVADNASRDLIIITLVSEHALTLNAATKAYASYAKDNGLTTAVVSHKESAMDRLAEEYTVDNWDHIAVRNAVVDLTHHYDIAESTARDYTKAYSRDILKVKHPKLDPRAAIFDWFKHTAPTLEGDMDEIKESFIEFATMDLGRSKSNANEYWKGYELHVFLSE